MLRILVPFRNAARWLPRCLESIRSQSVTKWTCHLADDRSDDASADVARELAGTDDRFVISRNPRRLHQCGSYRRLLGKPSLDDSDICVTVDADDWLPDNEVFARVLEAYSNPTVWLTWGTYARSDGEPGISGALEEAAQVRNVSWRTSHLRTWRLFLWKHILPEDFLGPTGEPLRVAGDLAFMFPMIEMAGNRHIRFLESVNYVYNMENPESNFRIRLEEQLRNEAFLRSKPAYEPLSDDAPPWFHELPQTKKEDRPQGGTDGHSRQCPGAPGQEAAPRTLTFRTSFCMNSTVEQRSSPGGTDVSGCQCSPASESDAGCVGHELQESHSIPHGAT